VRVPLHRRGRRGALAPHLSGGLALVRDRPRTVTTAVGGSAAATGPHLNVLIYAPTSRHLPCQASAGSLLVDASRVLVAEERRIVTREGNCVGEWCQLRDRRGNKTHKQDRLEGKAATE